MALQDVDGLEEADALRQAAVGGRRQRGVAPDERPVQHALVLRVEELVVEGAVVAHLLHSPTPTAKAGRPPRAALSLKRDGFAFINASYWYGDIIAVSPYAFGARA